MGVFKRNRKRYFLVIFKTLRSNGHIQIDTYFNSYLSNKHTRTKISDYYGYDLSEIIITNIIELSKKELEQFNK